jgi:hypothetical protein
MGAQCALISGIRLYRDASNASVVHLEGGGIIRTIGPFELEYVHPDGRRMEVFREYVVETIDMEVDEKLFCQHQEDYGELNRLYNLLPSNTSGVAAIWGGKWNNRKSISPSETCAIKKLILAASYMTDHPLKWENS